MFFRDDEDICDVCFWVMKKRVMYVSVMMMKRVMYVSVMMVMMMCDVCFCDDNDDVCFCDDDVCFCDDVDVRHVCVVYCVL